MKPFEYLEDAEKWMDENADVAPIGVLVIGFIDRLPHKWILDWSDDDDDFCLESLFEEAD